VKKHKKYIIRINGNKWFYSFIPFQDFEKEYDDGVAICVFHKKLIVFRIDQICLTTIMHELVHAYSHYICVSDTQHISAADYDEIYANFFEKYSLSILQNALHIYLKFHEKITPKTKNLIVKLMADLNILQKKNL
jgi:hypothetical protein